MADTLEEIEVDMLCEVEESEINLSDNPPLSQMNFSQKKDYMKSIREEQPSENYFIQP